MKTLRTYGWSDERAEQFQQLSKAEYQPARIIADYGRKYKIALPDERDAILAGSLTHKLASNDMPKIGDWVAVERIGDDILIQAVLPRTSEIVRGNASKQIDKQVVAANVNLAFVVQPLDNDFSLERLERYIFQLTNQHITPIVLLNKTDLTDDTADKQAAVSKLGVTVHAISAKNDAELSIVQQYIEPGTTIVVMGSSGAGKSTIINRLVGTEVQATGAIRERDGKGRHTTVHRELFVLPEGGMIIDTPGIRELQLWGTTAELDDSFPDIAEYIASCRFSNCSHTNENGCAIRAAIDNNTIDSRRYAAYVNLKTELQKLEDKRAFVDERRSSASKATAKRRRARTLRSERDRDLY